MIMKILITAFLALIMSASTSFSAEIIVGKCEKTQSVISKVKSLETGSGNEFMHMVAKNGTEAILIHTYNPKFEKYSGVIDADKNYFYYDFAKCTYHFEGQKKSYAGYFFVNKRPLESSQASGNSKIAKSEHVIYVGRVFAYNEAGMLWYKVTPQNAKSDVLLGAVYEFKGNIDQCLRKSDESGATVEISGILNTYKDKRMGKSMEANSVKCKQVK